MFWEFTSKKMKDKLKLGRNFIDLQRICFPRQYTVDPVKKKTKQQQPKNQEGKYEAKYVEIHFLKVSKI